MELYVKLDVKALQDGIIRKVGGVKHFAVISSIAAFVDSQGIAFPSQEKIAEMTGYSRKTVNATIKELRDTEIDGEKVMTIQQVKTAKGRSNIYKLSPKIGFSFGKGVVTNSDDHVTQQGDDIVTTGLQEQEPSINKNHTEQEPKNIVFDNARSVLQYFQEKYFETYGTTYKPNYVRDQSMIKKQLMQSFTDEELVLIIDTVFEHYDEQWGNPKFPRPSIGQLSSWLANKALAFGQDKRKQVEQVEADAEKYDYGDEYFDRLFEEF